MRYRAAGGETLFLAARCFDFLVYRLQYDSHYFGVDVKSNVYSP